MQERQSYIGRFAPSPTGPLHLGSLYTALAGFLQARSRRGKWLLRIDDLDTPRNVPGSAESILTTLESFGLHWDGPVDYQSRHIDEYEQALNHLMKNQLTYPCICSRKTLASGTTDHRQPDAYPGYCRNRQIPPGRAYALRIKTDNRVISFEDELHGRMTHRIGRQDGDFILKRKDRIFAYQFAVVIDDDRQEINHIVRGFDLLNETPKQIFLQQILGLKRPAYMHVPLIVDGDGFKLSKQTCAPAVDSNRPQTVLFELLRWLKQNPPLELKTGSVSELLDWAVTHWNPASLKNSRAIKPEFA
ncbi:MAG: tRNA glutamyl-Q(34) synthetase GluQRS [Gammaproteobacteria bacterium]